MESYIAGLIAALRMELSCGVSETTNAALTIEEFDEKTAQLRALEEDEARAADFDPHAYDHESEEQRLTRHGFDWRP